MCCHSVTLDRDDPRRLYVGISAAGALWVALQVAKQVERATIVFVVCDRGDRYLSTGVFPP
jgi:cysteine synthase B